MKIFGWLADTAGCGYYRVACPLWELERRGHEVSWLEAMPDTVIDDESGWDVIVGQRISLRGPSSIWQRLAAKRERRCTLVYELDDDLLNVDQANKPAHDYYTQQHEMVALHRSLTDIPFVTIEDSGRRQRIIDNITVADLVTVSTEPLAAVVSQWNPNVVVLPNCVPGQLVDLPLLEPGDVLTVGWRGSSSHARDFGELAKPLRGFLQKHADRVELHAIGHDFTDRVRSRRARIRHTGWGSVHEFLASVDFDFGVIPLHPTAFNDSKSDLALLELAARGIPAVASDVGPYRRAVDAGAPALLATSGADWTRHMTALLDEQYRTQLGAAAHEWARTRTIQAQAGLWEQAYVEARSGRRAA